MHDVGTRQRYDTHFDTPTLVGSGDRPYLHDGRYVAITESGPNTGSRGTGAN
jgi:hypothetical protein